MYRRFSKFNPGEIIRNSPGVKVLYFATESARKTHPVGESLPVVRRAMITVRFGRGLFARFWQIFAGRPLPVR